ncbi:NECAP, PHear domain [Dillenia turbinata]|uniref:NECAP, PHear domain n=1 Tax=Dillenia turbinata TaxID=194707 RepID=A0AAN8UPA9_9MAGN
MEEDQKESKQEDQESEESEPLELVLFQVSECYVYLIPPRKSAASYRADEWDVNKWAWEGILKVISKGEECIIRLEDKTTGETMTKHHLAYGGRIRHAFIGIGFRERPAAYDFQAALHDHMKYLDKKKTAEEMEQHFQHTCSVDYSLKEGETLLLQINNKSGSGLKSKPLEQGVSNISLEEKGNRKEPLLSIKPPPPPPGPLSPATTARSSQPNFPSNFKLDGDSEDKELSHFAKLGPENSGSLENQRAEDIPDDDFGDFQAAG